MEKPGNADAEKHEDAEVKTERKLNVLNRSQKVALAFVCAFMGTVLGSAILYMCLFSTFFTRIFELENMFLVFCTFLLACLLYVTCCIVGVTIIIQAKSRKYLNILQVAMFGVIFLNVLSPTLTLGGTCNGLCRKPDIHDSATFRECKTKPDMMPCPHLCEIRSSIIAMTGLALLCIILQIALRSLWDGIEEKDPYSKIFKEEDTKDKTGSCQGFNGMIPMFVINNKYHDLILKDTKESTSDPLENDEVVVLLPEHRVKNEVINYSTITDSSLQDKNSLASKSTTSINRKSRRRHKSVQTIETESFTKLEPMPKSSRIKFKSDIDRSRKAPEVLRSGGTGSSESDNINSRTPSSSGKSKAQLTNNTPNTSNKQPNNATGKQKGNGVIKSSSMGDDNARTGRPQSKTGKKLQR